MRRALLFLCVIMWPTAAFGQMNLPDLCANSAANIPAGVTVPVSNGDYQCLGIHGTVILTGKLAAVTVQVYPDGFLDVQPGSEIVIKGVAPTDPESFGTGLIVQGRIRMLGTVKTPYLRTTVEPQAGHTTLTLSGPPTNWLAGDEVFIPDTRQVPENDKFNPAYALQHEFRTIASVNGNVVTLTAPLTFAHRGARLASGQLAAVNGVVLLPHVANLSRSITVRSDAPSGIRGHVMVTGQASVEVRGAVFRDLGRTTTAPFTTVPGGNNQLGRYQFHVHMLSGPSNPTNTGFQFTLADNVFRDGTKWPGPTIHGSHFGLIEDNVVIGGTRLTGAGIAFEDGNETENLVRRNFIGYILADIDPRQTQPDGLTPGTGGDCIWAAGFNNRFLDNVLTGCRNVAQQVASGTGFKFIVHPDPNMNNRQNPRFRGAIMTDPTQTITVNIQRQPILEHRRNEAYGLIADGMTLWNLCTDGYSATQPCDGETVFDNMVVWHAYEGLMFYYPAKNVRWENPTFIMDATTTTKPAAFLASDYLVVNHVVNGGFISANSVLGGYFTAPTGAFTWRNVRSQTTSWAYVFTTPATPGTQAGLPSSGVTHNIITPQITPWPSLALRTIAMNHVASDTQFMNLPYNVNLTEGQTTIGVCYAVQATQNLYGKQCNNSQTRPDISGVVIGGGGTPPPSQEICGDGIDNDGDGQIDEGCPAPPQPCSGVTSPDGTRGVTITDAAKCVWSLGGPAPAGGLQTLREGVWMAQGGAVEYLWQGGQVYVRNNFTPPQWYRWNGASWLDVADPTTPAPPADADNDGVSDANDKCPGTAAGSTVDANGCSAAQRDTDGDGVNDALDKCPGTVPGTPVDAAGCAIPPPPTFSITVKNGACWPLVRSDSNGDGIEDNNTPDGAGGWSWQPFMDGVAWGRRVTSAPYQRQAQVATGSHSFTATWTKTGRPTVTTLAKTFTCNQF